MAKAVLVTGGNDGIGLALCTQLAVDHGCRVFMGSRSVERGEAAVAKIAVPKGGAGSVTLVQLDVTSDESVAAAVATVKAALGTEKLYGLVNNAGVGLMAGGEEGAKHVLAVNLYGTKRVTEAFLPLIAERIVMVSSGAAGGYVARLPVAAQTPWCTPPSSFAAIEALLEPSADGQTGVGSTADRMNGYGPSKAGVSSYTMLLAAEHPELTISACSPGFIATKMTAGYGASKSPGEGTHAIKHLLFEALEASGWYYGSDAVRSPYHFMRNPGEPVYDGVPPSVDDPRAKPA